MELRQAKHHTIANMTAMIMMSVPMPIPSTRVELVVCALAVVASSKSSRAISLPFIIEYMPVQIILNNIKSI